jgi:cephalosporin hydroxylase
MIVIDELRRVVTVTDGHGTHELPFASAEAFAAISRAWLAVGWDTKHVYSFTWLGRPIIQLPEDMFRIQEVICQLRPDVIIETGVAHGGSLVFYASVCEAIGQGRVIGVDVEIRPHNRAAIEAHAMFKRITLIEGDAIASETYESVRSLVTPGETVLVLLDSNHTSTHVLAELSTYGQLVTKGSYIVATDGIMAQVAGGPRTKEDWYWNNPLRAIECFLTENDNFVAEEPVWSFNEGLVTERVTYWPKAFLRRIK